MTISGRDPKVGVLGFVKIKFLNFNGFDGRSMKTLVIGSGAREHAMAWKLYMSEQVSSVHSFPGNISMRDMGPTHDGDICDFKKIQHICNVEHIDLLAIGPEVPLSAGIVDYFAGSDIKVFGPSKASSQLESSKAFAKDLLSVLGIPSPLHHTFQDFSAAKSWVESNSVPLVIKADGLAAGKGVFIADTKEEQLSAVYAIMSNRIFGESGDKIVIEEKIEGPEISVFVFCDGTDISDAVVACDYKRIGDGDVGPNTGGMGSYSYPGIISEAQLSEIKEIILRPVVEHMAEIGTPYSGVLYAGLMLTTSGPQVLEFNCRFGDPEAQVILPRLESDLGSVMYSCAAGKLSQARVSWDDKASVGVVLASEGYPDAYKTGFPVTGLDHSSSGTYVFCGGVKEGQEDSIITSGGRVLTVVGHAENVQEARDLSYARSESINFINKFHRNDIGSFMRTA